MKKAKINPKKRIAVPVHYTPIERVIWERIHQRRRQVLIHSVLYYRLDKSIIEDQLFDKWAYELVQLQKDYPKISESVPYHLDAFRAFDATTCFDLPISDSYALQIATFIHKLSDSK